MTSKLILPACLLALIAAQTAEATLITDPDDPRSWQSANVGTFAQFYYGSNTLANRQQVVTNQLLDDGWFDPTGYSAATVIKFNGVDVIANPNYGSYGTSLDAPNSVNASQGTYNYSYSGVGAAAGLNSIDANWAQTDSIIGNTIFDLGFQASKAAVFNTIDHGPMPQEAIESTVYLSNDKNVWVQAVTQRVWMEGIYSDTTLLWDGFVYAVGAPNGGTFRYASVIWGGPGALISDGDNEINGLMGLQGDFTPPTATPEPASMALLGIGLAGLGAMRRRKSS